ncbi:alanine racemase [uncultured Desulfovibrio sp.]|uniref:Alanine racemase n=1 Tax=Candidatus Desulfovibrio intestinavium TaxID=2838534 RepID=A0A9D2KP44_9BACT|nr:alanine racemase [uncultured Desulfovibrio sp.]HJA78372.1 alanine racemase [Candidatus Desulfovibrio intestinavium]
MTCIFTPSACHINLPALQRNFARLGAAENILPVIKSDAYGHGLLPVARALDRAGARQFAVGTVSEGISLRDEGYRQRVVALMGGMCSNEWAQAADAHLTLVAACFEDLQNAAEGLGDRGESLEIALKLDTGMGRLGFDGEELPALLAALEHMPRLVPVMALSHMPSADMPEDEAFSLAQIERFRALCEPLRQRWPGLARSLANTAGTLGLPQARFELCRPGFALYGGNPFAGGPWEARGAGLEWVMSLSAPVMQVRRIRAGQSLSYGRTFTAARDMDIAVIACGYATAYPRALSNRSAVLLHGRRAPVVGRVCMSMMMVDVSHIPGVSRGDTAWLMGGEAAAGETPITVCELARLADVLPYELLCLLGEVNPRQYII